MSYKACRQLALNVFGEVLLMLIVFSFFLLSWFLGPPLFLALPPARPRPSQARGCCGQ